ncbi:MAG TPA: hypothetical protein DD827_06045 [Gammaproteobacteria bacterium]|jgi:hypothetical protein|nr:hypothetical protein [Gammaproteobacteria bacterium]
MGNGCNLTLSKAGALTGTAQKPLFTQQMFVLIKMLEIEVIGFGVNAKRLPRGFCTFLRRAALHRCHLLESRWRALSDHPIFPPPAKRTPHPDT